MEKERGCGAPESPAANNRESSSAGNRQARGGRACLSSVYASSSVRLQREGRGGVRPKADRAGTTGARQTDTDFSEQGGGRTAASARIIERVKNEGGTARDENGGAKQFRGGPRQNVLQESVDAKLLATARITNNLQGSLYFR